jgi:solute carrier family 25 carnitine/acylcarnitine transporter 20/29
MRTSQNLHLGEEALGGLSAGIVGTIIGYPLDLVKTRMQTSGGSLSIAGVASSVVRHEGVFALYKGIAPPLISLSILNTLNFSSYSFFRDLLHAKHGWDYRNAVAGMMGAPIGSMVSTVENLVKTQMQLDNISRQRFEGSWHCVRSLVQSHGLSVLYTGHVVNTFREMTFLGCYFLTYEGFRQGLVGSHIPAKVAVPVAGGMAGALSWFVSFPLDCVRAGVQGHNLDDTKRVRAWRVLSNLIKERGVRGLYSGVTPSICRAFLVSGSRFSAYEGALWLLRGVNTGAPIESNELI